MESVSPDGDIELTEQQWRFVAEFVADPRSATRAYQRAFNLPYTHDSSRQQACNLLKKPNVKRAIERCRHDWCRRHRVTFQNTVRKLASIALGDPGDLYESDPDNGGLPKPRPWDQIPPTARKNIKTVKFKRRKLKSVTDEVYELEEFEYRVCDPEWALGKLCEYLGVTKGALSADDLRGLIYGNATPNAPTTPNDSGAGGPGNLPASDTQPIVPDPAFIASVK